MKKLKRKWENTQKECQVYSNELPENNIKPY